MNLGELVYLVIKPAYPAQEVPLTVPAALLLIIFIITHAKYLVQLVPTVITTPVMTVLSTAFNASLQLFVPTVLPTIY